MVSRRSALSIIAGAASFGRADSGALAQPVSVLRIATALGDDFTPVLYALRRGYYRKAGLDVQVTVMQSGAAIAAAVAGGALDIGKSSLLPLINAHVRGVPFVLVAAGPIHNAKYPISELVIRPGDTFKTGKDLDGKVAACAAIGDLISLVTKMWVDQTGGDSRTLKFVEIPTTALVPALTDHRVDVVILTHPALQEALENRSVERLSSPFDALGNLFMMSAWFATDDWATKNIELVKRFARVTAQTAQYTNVHHAETEAMMAEWSKIPPAVFAKMPRVDTASAVDPASIQPVIDAAAKYAMLPHAFPAKELILERN